MTSCAPCGIECGNYDGLVFDCRYQFPVGPVCDFPDNVNCTNGYTTDTNYPTHPTVPTTTTPEGYCKSDADCTGSSCSHCVNHACVDPECCTDDECGDITNMVCSVCSMDTCSRPECCVDEDCPVIKICVNIYCSLSIRMDMFAKMRNVWRKENVTLTVRVKMQMQSVISQTITTVNGVTWMRKSVSQVRFFYLTNIYHQSYV